MCSVLSAQCFYRERISALQTICRPCLGQGTLDEAKLKRESRRKAKTRKNNSNVKELAEGIEVFFGLVSRDILKRFHL